MFVVPVDETIADPKRVHSWESEQTEMTVHSYLFQPSFMSDDGWELQATPGSLKFQRPSNHNTDWKTIF
jgi:hypothetical protein